MTFDCFDMFLCAYFLTVGVKLTNAVDKHGTTVFTFDNTQGQADAAFQTWKQQTAVVNPRVYADAIRATRRVITISRNPVKTPNTNILEKTNDSNSNSHQG